MAYNDLECDVKREAEGVYTNQVYRWRVSTPTRYGGGGCLHQPGMEAEGVYTNQVYRWRVSTPTRYGGGGCLHQPGMEAEGVYTNQV